MKNFRLFSVCESTEENILASHIEQNIHWMPEEWELFWWHPIFVSIYSMKLHVICISSLIITHRKWIFVFRTNDISVAFLFISALIFRCNVCSKSLLNSFTVELLTHIGLINTCVTQVVSLCLLQLITTDFVRNVR